MSTARERFRHAYSIYLATFTGLILDDIEEDMSKAIDLEKKIVPTHFITSEGSEWIRYIGTGFSLVTLENGVTGSLPLRYDETPNMSAVRLIAYDREAEKYRHVHALAFDDPGMGFGNFPYWDIISGWITPIK